MAVGGKGFRGGFELSRDDWDGCEEGGGNEVLLLLLLSDDVLPKLAREKMEEILFAERSISLFGCSLEESWNGGHILVCL